jgi:hypothetical protein
MKYPRKSPKLLKLILAVLIFAMSVLIGCAGESVRVEFPINHPANPEAHETEFILPQNPFQTDVAVMEGETETDSMMKHNLHEESSKQHMDHDMEHKKEIQSESESIKKPAHLESGNQHQEHN